jgi:hypothetical protein
VTALTKFAELRWRSSVVFSAPTVLWIVFGRWQMGVVGSLAVAGRDFSWVVAVVGVMTAVAHRRRVVSTGRKSDL